MPTRIILGEGKAATPLAGGDCDANSTGVKIGENEFSSHKIKIADPTSTAEVDVRRNTNHHNNNNNNNNNNPVGFGFDFGLGFRFGAGPKNSKRDTANSVPAKSTTTALRREDVASHLSPIDKIVGFRSSILRERLSRRHGTTVAHRQPATEKKVEGEGSLPTYQECDRACQQHRTEDNARLHHLSADDIRASPRLTGYLFALIASSVMLISTILFFDKNKHYDNSCNPNMEVPVQPQFPPPRGTILFCTENGPVYYWKLYGSLLLSTLGVLIHLIVLILHFDTVCAPTFWYTIFKAGSKYEHHFIIVLLLYCFVSLYVSTSSFSVGEAQANVFFTTWIVCSTTALNYSVWRESALLPSLVGNINQHHRETTYNWVWTLFSLFIAAAFTTDYYCNRHEINEIHKASVHETEAGRARNDESVTSPFLELTEYEWLRLIILLWSFVGISMVALLLNHVWKRAWKCFFGDCCQFVISWKYLEGIIIFIIVSILFWIILEYTGVDGLVNGLNNIYFGIWGAFFNAVFTFGTWLRENNDIDLI